MAKKQSGATYDKEILLKAATLYYTEGLNQEQLAKRFSMSRPTIVRMLKKAREIGLVEIKITEPLPSTIILETDIESRFEHRNLRQVIVVASSVADAKSMVAKRASKHLSKIIKAEDILGVGWSSTLTHMPEYLKPGRFPPLRIVQLGGFVSGVGDATAQAISMNIGRVLKSPVETVPVPVIVSSKDIRDALLNEPTIKAAGLWVEKCTIGLVGIGIASQVSPLVTAGYLKIPELNEVVTKGAVGDILSHYYDITGKEIQSKWRERTISVEFDQLMAIDNLIAVVAGIDKAESVLGALRSGLVNTLICDKLLAARLLYLAGPVK